MLLSTQKLTRIGLLFYIFFITGCSFGFDIIVENVASGLPYFKLERQKGILGNQNYVELTSFSVVENIQNEWNYKNPLWEFKVEPGSALKVSQFQYGKSPPGFLETTKVKPLEPGKRYLAIGYGPGSSGSIEFTIPQKAQ